MGSFKQHKHLKNHTLMKYISTFLIILFSLTAFGQQIALKEWNEQAKTNMRMLPKYGDQQKTKQQKESDKNFIQEVIQQDKFKGDRLAASNHMIALGFNYLYRGDLKTAMYRFNQAYLLDSTNTDIYWGYGAVYTTLTDYGNAKLQYENGLLLQSKNTHLLTDYGTLFMAQYYQHQAVDELNAQVNLDSALYYLSKSYQIDNQDQNTLYKLSICYLIKGNCNNAWKYYDECMALGGQPIDEEYTQELNNNCKRDK